jgi:hypothetical protein
MKNHVAFFLICFGTISHVSAQEEITYSVVTSLPKPNMLVKVVIDDDHSYLLEADESSILFRGEAPEASSNYRYAIYDGEGDTTLVESFSREPVSESTVNEFFNRSKNVHELAPLPQVYQPLSVLNRLQSDLHIEGEIPTIHLWGDQNEIDHMHQNQLEDVKIRLNMDYIG